MGNDRLMTRVEASLIIATLAILFVAILTALRDGPTFKPVEPAVLTIDDLWSAWQ